MIHTTRDITWFMDISSLNYLTQIWSTTSEMQLELVGGFMHKQLYKYLKPYNSLHLRPDERKYYTASTQKHAGGTIRRPVQQPQRLCLEYRVNCIKCHSEEVTEKQPRIRIQSATVNKCTMQESLPLYCVQCATVWILFLQFLKIGKYGAGFLPEM